MTCTDICMHDIHHKFKTSALACPASALFFFVFFLRSVTSSACATERACTVHVHNKRPDALLHACKTFARKTRLLFAIRLLTRIQTLAPTVAARCRLVSGCARLRSAAEASVGVCTVQGAGQRWAVQGCRGMCAAAEECVRLCTQR